MLKPGFKSHIRPKAANEPEVVVEDRSSGEIGPGNYVFQAFRANADFLSAVSIMVGTYRRVQNCHLTFCLYELSP